MADVTDNTDKASGDCDWRGGNATTEPDDQRPQSKEYHDPGQLSARQGLELIDEVDWWKMTEYTEEDAEDNPGPIKVTYELIWNKIMSLSSTTEREKIPNSECEKWVPRAKVEIHGGRYSKRYRP